MVCKDVATEPVLQDVEGEQLTLGRIKRRMQDWIYMHVVSGSPSDQPFLMLYRVCLPNAESYLSYRDLEQQQIYRLHKNEKKR